MKMLNRALQVVATPLITGGPMLMVIGALNLAGGLQWNRLRFCYFLFLFAGGLMSAFGCALTLAIVGRHDTVIRELQERLAAAERGERKKGGRD